VTLDVQNTTSWIEADDMTFGGVFGSGLCNSTGASQRQGYLAVAGSILWRMI
jgi:hypothetical protein